MFDYGPLNDLSKGFQVLFASRQTNAAGGEREVYYSTGGTLDLEKNLVSDEGGLTARYAGDMGMQPKLLAKRWIAEAAKGKPRPRPTTIPPRRT